MISSSSSIGPKSFLKVTFCLNAFGTNKISEKIIAASKLNLLIGCKVISLDNSSFKHKLTKFGFSDLIFLNSGKYLPACLINHTHLSVDKLFIQFCNLVILIDNILFILVVLGMLIVIIIYY